MPPGVRPPAGNQRRWPGPWRPTRAAHRRGARRPARGAAADRRCAAAGARDHPAGLPALRPRRPPAPPLQGRGVCRNCVAKASAVPCTAAGRPRTGHPRRRRPAAVPELPGQRPGQPGECARCGRRRRVKPASRTGRLRACPPVAVLACSICGRDRPCGMSSPPVSPGAAPASPLAGGMLALRPARRIGPAPGEAPSARLRGAGGSGGLHGLRRPPGPQPRECPRCRCAASSASCWAQAGAMPPGLQVLHTTGHRRTPRTALSWLSRHPDGARRARRRAARSATGTRRSPGKASHRAPAPAARRHRSAARRDEQLARIEPGRRPPASEHAAGQRQRTAAPLRRLAPAAPAAPRNRGAPPPASVQHGPATGGAAVGCSAGLHERPHPGQLPQADLDRWLPARTPSTASRSGALRPLGDRQQLNALISPPPGGPAPPGRWTTRPAGTSQAAPARRHPQPGTGSPGCWCCSTPSGPRRSAGSPSTTSTPARRSGSASGVPVVLPEPVAALTRDLAGHRRGHATLGAGHLTLAVPRRAARPPGQRRRLGERLRQLGSAPGKPAPRAVPARHRAARRRPRPPARHPHQVAVAWQHVSAGDWTSYAADVSHRTHHPIRHSNSSNI